MFVAPGILAEELQGASASDPRIIERAKRIGKAAPSRPRWRRWIKALKRTRTPSHCTNCAATSWRRRALRRKRSKPMRRSSVCNPVPWTSDGPSGVCLVRSGQGEQSVEELRRIAAVDTHNPLIHLRLRGSSKARSPRGLTPVVPRKRSNSRRTCMGGGSRWPAHGSTYLDYEGAVTDVQYVLSSAPRFAWSCRPIPWPQCFTATRKTETIRSGVCLEGHHTRPVEAMTLAARGRVENVRGRRYHGGADVPEVLELNPRDPSAALTNSA